MAFCQNCGKELANGAKFCDGCGASVGASVADGSKRTIKFMAGGEIIKCPQCGEQGFSKFATACPACGYKFEAQAKSSYVEEIQRTLEQCDGSLKDELRIVKNIICPNDVQAMYEMLIFASERISSVGDDTMKSDSYSKLVKKAWFGIICSIEKKASIMFGNTEEGKKLIQNAKFIKQSTVKEVYKITNSGKVGVFYLVFFLALICIGYFGGNHEEKVADKKFADLETEIVKSIDAKDWDSAEYFFRQMTFKDSHLSRDDEKKWKSRKEYLQKKLSDAKENNNE